MTFYGNRDGKPYANQELPRFVGNELRDWHFVGFHMVWEDQAGIEVMHVMTAWGDDGSEDTLGENPEELKVTDSDRDYYAPPALPPPPPKGLLDAHNPISLPRLAPDVTGGDVQTYRYEEVVDPGGERESAWRLDYFPEAPPTICAVITLSPIDGGGCTQSVVGSYEIEQTEEQAQTGLHYQVGTDSEILSYETGIDWGTTHNPYIEENGDPPSSLAVQWDLSDQPVPEGELVRITTEFVLPGYNDMWYDEVYFEPSGASWLGRFHWNVSTPDLPPEDLMQPGIAGGFVVGAFDIYADAAGNELLGRYRFMHEYDYAQNPEAHTLRIDTLDEVLYVRNLRLGHSWSMLHVESLWRFDTWLSEYEPIEIYGTFEEPLDWSGSGLRPYFCPTLGGGCPTLLLRR